MHRAGCQLVFQPEDDQATPQVAGQAATKLASDPNVVGVVGTLNSSTSQTVQPILADRSIVRVSPANTNPTLTLGEDPTGRRSGRSRATSASPPRT